MLLVWDPTTKLEFSFKIIRSDFVEEVEKRLTEAWEFRDTSSQKDAGCGLALITRWTGPTQVTLACLPKNRHLSHWNVCASSFFPPVKNKSVTWRANLCALCNASEWVRDGQRRPPEKNLEKTLRLTLILAWGGNLRKDIGIYGLDILWILPVVFPGKCGDLSQSHRRCSTLKQGGARCSTVKCRNYCNFPKLAKQFWG